QHTKAARADAGRSMGAPNLSGRLTNLNSEKPHACWALPLHQTPFLCVLHLVLACVRCRHFALSHFRIFRRLYRTTFLMQALARFTPNSDIDCVFRHVRFGPKADIGPCSYSITSSARC